MKRIPKTPIEFDYDLWTTEDGKYMVRVKRTGEVSEVDHDVMKILRAEEKKVRRALASPGQEDSEKKPTVMSIEAVPDEVKEAAWLADPHDFTEDVMMAMLEEEFIALLTDAQRDIYIEVLKGGMKPSDYAKANGISASGVTQHIHAIQIKAKNYF